MVSLSSLVLPIGLSAVFVFLASFLMHMVLPHHRSDFKKLPSEPDVMDALRKFNIPPGDYMTPKPASMADMRSQAYLDKMNRGPVMITTVLPTGVRGMGAQLAQWFVFCLVVSIFAGYLASRALPAGAEYLRVSQIASTTAFMGYILAQWSQVVWYRKSVSATVKSTIDALLYGLITGGTLGWLWPK
jgi:hypothetical protein